MAFIEIEGFLGKVFVPDESRDVKKHDCKDCFVCQMCSDERCEFCLKSHGKRDRKSSDKPEPA